MSEHFYKTIKIENFRGIKSLEINDLARVNLFVGRNNCGKTSVLEAAFLLTGISNPDLMIRIGNWRGVALNDSSDIQNYFYARNHEQGMKFLGLQGKGQRVLDVSTVSGNLYSGNDINTGDTKSGYSPETRFENFETGEALIGFKYEFSIADAASSENKIHQASTCRTQGDQPNFTQTSAEGYKEKTEGRFLWPNGYNHDFIDKMLTEKRKDTLLNSLQLIAPEIQDIKSGAGGIVSVDTGLDSFIPVNLLGDGAVRILNILSSIDGTRNGILTIDEVENGLHISAIRLMWEMVLNHSATCETQVFATTHSADVISVLAQVLSSRIESNCEKNEAACFVLEKSDTDEVRAFKYSHEELLKSENSGIDIR
ncbi:MAG: AAA family ATPase [Gammaproteobacteria bacterium]|nr:AAA family ATPase [Gammaproteobacteria bacterium]